MAGFSTSLFQSEWIPASRGVPRSRQKVMIVLHGQGDTLEAFRSLKRELRLPDFNYLLLNAPRRYLNGFSWCALDPRRTQSLKDVRSRLVFLVSELEQEGWDTKEIFWMGHSQGCLVACDLVLHHPKRFGGVIGVSGYLSFERDWRSRAMKTGARSTPWLITHGTRDRIIRPSEIREDVRELATARIHVLYREFSKGHDFDHRNEVPFIRSWIRSSRASKRNVGASKGLRA